MPAIRIEEILPIELPSEEEIWVETIVNIIRKHGGRMNLNKACLQFQIAGGNRQRFVTAVIQKTI